MASRININNYEAFLLDYIEGNLSEQDISILKEFVLLHPELEINLEDTELVILKAENISLSSKQNLKKPHLSISDEQFIAYVENTLSQEEKEKLELICSGDATLSKELRLYQSAVLKPDATIIFENKQSLKKQNKVIWFNARVSLSTAAALLLIFGLWFVLRNINSDTENNNKLSENKNTITTNTLASVNSFTVNNQNTIHSPSISIHEFNSPKNNLANTIKTPVTNSFTLPLIANNINDSIKSNKEEKIVVIKKDSVTTEIKIAANNPPSTKNTYIVTQGVDDDVAENANPKEKTTEKKGPAGFWNKASKALKNLNKLGVKNVDGQETVISNNEQTVLSLGNFKIEKNRYNQE